MILHFFPFNIDVWYRIEFLYQSVLNRIIAYDSAFWFQGPFATFKLQQDKGCDWTGLKFSPDGKLILISTNGSVVRLVDAFQGTPLQTFMVRSSFSIYAFLRESVEPSGFDFPRGPGANAPRFCCGLLDFSDLGARNSIYICIIIQNSYFWPLDLSKDRFGPLAWNLSVRPWVHKRSNERTLQGQVRVLNQSQSHVWRSLSLPRHIKKKYQRLVNLNQTHSSPSKIVWI